IITFPPHTARAPYTTLFRSLVHKALLSGDLDLYVEYTGTALTTVLDEKPQGSARDVYLRVKKLYAERFRLEVMDPLGFENTFAIDRKSTRLNSSHASISYAV